MGLEFKSASEQAVAKFLSRLRIAQPGRVPAHEAGGRRFKSDCAKANLRVLYREVQTGSQLESMRPSSCMVA